VEVFADKKESAYRKKYRPALNRMMASAKQGKFKFIYVHKVDRLSRRLPWTFEIIMELEEYGVEVIFAEYNYNRDTPDGKLQFTMTGMMAEHYSDNLSRETKKGKYQLTLQGYHNGMFPWGYEKTIDENNRRVGKPIPQLIPVIQELFSR